jgi:hypothetical protein
MLKCIKMIFFLFFKNYFLKSTNQNDPKHKKKLIYNKKNLIYSKKNLNFFKTCVSKHS